MDINIGDNYFLKKDISDDISMLTTTNKCNVFDVEQSKHNKKSFYVDKDFFKKYFNINEIYLPNQIHSNKIIFLDDDYTFEDCDGLISDKKNTALGIVTADCFPLLIFSNSYIANLHCGWRGIYSGIVERAIDFFESNGEQIKGAVIGVGICDKCYTVDYELIKQFSKKYNVDCYYKDNRNKFHLSLRDIIAYILNKHNVENIFNMNYCTSCCSFLYSYRRDSKTRKRLLTLIWKK
jgi:YfiH family protein